MFRRYKTRVVPISSSRGFSSHSGGGSSSSGNKNVVQHGNKGSNQQKQQQQPQEKNAPQQQDTAKFGNNFEEQMVALGASVMGQMAQWGQQQQQEKGGGGQAPMLANFFSAMGDMAKVKTWHCWCGHKFEAPGQWIPCERALCQAPGCPNPKYFMTDEGAKRIGQPIPEISDGKSGKK